MSDLQLPDNSDFIQFLPQISFVAPLTCALLRCMSASGYVCVRVYAIMFVFGSVKNFMSESQHTQ